VTALFYRQAKIRLSVKRFVYVFISSLFEREVPMPIYEYECAHCEKVFEVQQRISDDPLETCPDCHGAVKKLVSVSSFQLKGGGWYADGYSGASNGKGKNGTPAAKKDAPAKSPCQAGGSCKSCPATAA